MYVWFIFDDVCLHMKDSYIYMMVYQDFIISRNNNNKNISISQNEHEITNRYDYNLQRNKKNEIILIAGRQQEQCGMQ